MDASVGATAKAGEKGTEQDHVSGSDGISFGHDG
jgi:hypothetical protein